MWNCSVSVRVFMSCPRSTIDTRMETLDRVREGAWFEFSEKGQS